MYERLGLQGGLRLPPPPTKGQPPLATPVREYSNWAQIRPCAFMS